MRSEVKQRIGEIIEEAIRAGDTAGALVLFREGGEETFFDAHGYANVERGEKLRRDHIFRLFSMTKPVTAVAVMTLLEKGELDIGQPVCELIPGFAGDRLIENGVERKSPTVMTVNHLLNMTSGLTYGGLGSQSEKKITRFLLECDRKLHTDEAVTTVEFARRLSELPLSFEPGTSWQYGLSADVLGAVVECVTGMRYGDYLEEAVFKPLGMCDTGFFVPEEKQHRLADCYRSTGQGDMKPFTGDNLFVSYRMQGRPAFESGGAGLVSTIDDYSRFAQMLLNGGELDGRRILKKRTVEFLISGDLTPRQNQKLWDLFGLTGFTYSHLMRQMRGNGSYTGLTRGREYGWDSWTGCYFTNIPEENRCMLLLEQKAETGTTPMIRKIRNVWLADE